MIRVKGKAEPQTVWEAFDTSRIPDMAFIQPYEEAREALPLFPTILDAGMEK
jgi:hypothetical protein